MQFAQNLKRVMQDKKITNYRLAKMLGVHPTTIKNWLESNTEPKFDMIDRIASALDVYPEQLIFLPRPSPEDMDISEIDNNDIPEEDWKEILKWNSKEEITYSIDELTKKFDMLNKRGKKKVYEYANDICKIKEYTTPDEE